MHLRILYARGTEPLRLAEALSENPIRVTGDLHRHCIETRAEAVVMRRLSASFDLVPQLVPHDLKPQEATKVIAAVGGGPHSELAAVVAHALGERLRVPAELVCAYRSEEGPDQALRSVSMVEDSVPGLPHRIVEAGRASDLIDEEAEGAVLILGAPGGSFFQRRFFGPGARIVAKAPVGAVTVRSAPRRAFHEMGEPDWVGTLLPATEALRLSQGDVIPVVDGGIVVGVVTRDLLAAAGSAPVGEVMDEIITVRVDEPLEEVRQAAALHGGTAAIVDDDGRLVGVWRHQ